MLNKGKLPESIDTVVRMVFAGQPAMRTLVLDQWEGDSTVEPEERYQAIVRSPDGYLVLGKHPDPYAAEYEGHTFYDRLRELLRPADPDA